MQNRDIFKKPTFLIWILIAHTYFISINYFTYLQYYELIFKIRLAEKTYAERLRIIIPWKYILIFGILGWLSDSDETKLNVLFSVVTKMEKFNEFGVKLYSLIKVV